MGFSDVQHLVEVFSYPAVLLLLTACGMGAPLSEDLVLVAAGFVTAKTGASLPLMMVTAWVGLLVGDSLLFRLGSRYGVRVTRWRGFSRLFTRRRVAWAHRHFRRHGALTVFVVRFCIGLRVVTYLTAGMSGMRYRRFLLADAVAAAVFAPLVVFLGHRFGRAVLDDVHSALTWAVGTVLVVAALAAAVGWARRRAAGRPSQAL